MPWNLAMGQLPSPDGARALAIPNYILFMLLAIAAIVLVGKRARQDRTRKLTLVAVFVWCTAEIISWFLDASGLDIGHDVAISIEGAMTLLFSLAILALTERIAADRRSILTRQTRHY